MATKGYKDNDQQAFTPAPTDWLGIQQGDLLSDMKKITYGDLKSPIQVELDDHEERIDDLELAEDSVKGTGWAGETVKGNADGLDGHITDVANPHAVTKAQVGLGNVDNTSDKDKPLSDADIAALALKVDKVAGKSLSDENYTLLEKQKLADTYIKGEVDAGLALKTDKTTTAALDTRVQVLENWNPLKSWADVQRFLRAGRIDNYLKVGDQLIATYENVAKVWDVIGIDEDTPENSSFTHSLTIQSRTLLGTGQISAPQAIVGAIAEIPAGTHIFTLNGVKYQVTTTQPVPIGGVMYGSAWGDTYVPTKITTYGADRKTVLESNLDVTVSVLDVNMAVINDHVRCRYGSNLYFDSAIRQFLNSTDATFAWTPKGLFDMPSNYGASGGFLNRLDPELVAVLGSVEKKVARASYDGGGQDTFNDKIFLLSRLEMGFGGEGVTTGEFVYPFWDGASDADRIKGLPSYWWLRSPHVSYTYCSRIVYTSGVLNNYYSNYSHAISPACVIV